MKAAIAFVLAMVVAVPVTQARQDPERSPSDGRIRYVEYNDGDVVRVRSAMRQSTVVTFAPGERITEVSPGDPKAWLVKPNKVKTRLYLRPLVEDGQTNLNVFTDQGRAYSFELTIVKGRSIGRQDRAWRLHFTYPWIEAEDALAEYEAKHAAEVSARVPSSAWNLDYSVAGDAAITPRHVFDDGTHTYFEFEDKSPSPAIFAVDTNGDESLVNWHLDPSGRYVVVEAVKPQFTLRSGALIACLWNDRLYTRAPTANTPDKALGATVSGGGNDEWDD